MKKQVFLRAWKLYRANLYQTFSEALTAAWQFVKLTAALKKGVVEFTFRKLNGSIRKATGTAITENNYQHKGGEVSDKPSIVRYFDLDRQAVRSFNIYQYVK